MTYIYAYAVSRGRGFGFLRLRWDIIVLCLRELTVTWIILIQEQHKSYSNSLKPRRQRVDGSERLEHVKEYAHCTLLSHRTVVCLGYLVYFGATRFW